MILRIAIENEEVDMAVAEGLMMKQIVITLLLSLVLLYLLLSLGKDTIETKMMF